MNRSTSLPETAMLCFFAARYTLGDLVKQSALLINSFTYSQIERESRPFDWNKVLCLSQIQMVLSMSSLLASSSLHFFFFFPFSPQNPQNPLRLLF